MITRVNKFSVWERDICYVYEFTKAVCNFVNLSFEIRFDHLKSVNQIM